MDTLIDRQACARLHADFKAVISDAEALLKGTADNGGAEMRELRARIEHSLGNVRTRLRGTEEEVLDRGREVIAESAAYLQAHPWRVLGLATGLALIVGWLSYRR